MTQKIISIRGKNYFYNYAVSEGYSRYDSHFVFDFIFALLNSLAFDNILLATQPAIMG